jgi:hypothetical protein
LNSFLRAPAGENKERIMLDAQEREIFGLQDNGLTLPELIQLQRSAPRFQFNKESEDPAEKAFEKLRLESMDIHPTPIESLPVPGERIFTKRARSEGDRIEKGPGGWTFVYNTNGSLRRAFAPGVSESSFAR